MVIISCLIVYLVGYMVIGYKISYWLVVNYNFFIYNDEIIRIKSKGKNYRGS